MCDVTAVPLVAPFFKGLINLRGREISVLGLRLKLGLEALWVVRPIDRR